MKVKTGMRCCPSCGGDEMDKATTREEFVEMGCHRFRCCGCGWSGCGLHLAAKELPPSPLADMLKTLQKEAEATYKP